MIIFGLNDGEVPTYVLDALRAVDEEYDHVVKAAFSRQGHGGWQVTLFVEGASPNPVGGMWFFPREGEPWAEIGD